MTAWEFSYGRVVGRTHVAAWGFSNGRVAGRTHVAAWGLGMVMKRDKRTWQLGGLVMVV